MTLLIQMNSQCKNLRMPWFMEGSIFIIINHRMVPNNFPIYPHRQYHLDFLGFAKAQKIKRKLYRGVQVVRLNYEHAYLEIRAHRGKVQLSLQIFLHIGVAWYGLQK